MRILFVDSTRGLYGASRAMLTLLQSLDRSRFEPFVVLSNDVDDGDLRLLPELRRIRVPYLEMPLSVLRRKKYLNPRGILYMGGALFSSVLRLRRLIRRYKIEIVQTNTSTVLSGAVAAKLAGVPHIWHVHEILYGKEARVLGALMDHSGTGIVAVSEAAAQSLRDGRPQAGGKINIIPNGIDPTPFQQVDMESATRLRQEWGAGKSKGDGPPLIGMIGRLGMWKGEEQFVAMSKSVAQQRKDARFVIVGGTFDNQTEPVERLKRLIANEGLQTNFIVAGLREDIHNVLQALDILVHLPSKPEPFGLVAIEAMSCGIPVIAAKHGGLAEIVKDGYTGFLVPPHDSEAAAARVLELLDNPAKCSRMSLNARLRAQLSFSAHAYTQRFEELWTHSV